MQFPEPPQTPEEIRARIDQVLQAPQEIAPRSVPEGEFERRPPELARRSKLVRLAAQGCNAKRASELTGLGYVTVCREYNDPSFRRQVFALVEGAFGATDTAFQEEILSLGDRIKAKSEAAFDVLVGMLEDEAEMPALRAKIALEILDRNPETQPGHTVRSGSLVEAPQLALAARAAEEMNRVLPFKKKA